MFLPLASFVRMVTLSCHLFDEPPVDYDEIVNRLLADNLRLRDGNGEGEETASFKSDLRQERKAWPRTTNGSSRWQIHPPSHNFWSWL